MRAHALLDRTIAFPLSKEKRMGVPGGCGVATFLFYSPPIGGMSPVAELADTEHVEVSKHPAKGGQSAGNGFRLLFSSRFDSTLVLGGVLGEAQYPVSSPALIP